MSNLLHVDPDAAKALASAGLTSVGDILRYRPTALAALSGSSETFPVDAGGDLGRVFVKRYRYRSLRVRLEGMFRGTLFGTSRAKFEYDFLREMRRRGLPAVWPLAYGEKRKRGFLRACFLITSEAKHTKSIDCLLGHEASEARDRRSLAAALGRQVRAIHDAGVVHGGLFGRNVMAGQQGGEWGFCLLDPDRRGRLVIGPVPHVGVVSDLSDLVATGVHLTRRTDFLRFARAYLDCRRIPDRHKPLLQEIMEASKTKVRQEGHRLAVGSTISWLAERIERLGSGGPRFSSAQEFLEAGLGSPDPEACGRNLRKVGAAFSGCSGGPPGAYRLRIDVERNGSVPGEANATRAPNLTSLEIRTSERVWLAIVNGDPAVFEMLRTDGFDVRGDTKLLGAMRQALDRAPRTAPR